MNDQFPKIEETHCKGHVSIENPDMIVHMLRDNKKSYMDTDLGIQISEDGRVWVCINGVALLRFKPKQTK